MSFPKEHNPAYTHRSRRVLDELEKQIEMHWNTSLMAGDPETRKQASHQYMALCDMQDQIYSHMRKLAAEHNVVLKSCTEDLVILKSVGAAYDPETQFVYSLLKNGVPEYESYHHVTECVIDWWMEMSSNDILLMLNHVNKEVIRNAPSR